ncbi:MAG: DUF1501 domain-containing protein [Gemmataceae bacterium]
MLGFSAQGTRLCDGITRREWMRLGALTTLGLATQSTPTASGSSSSSRAKACIVLFHLGGPPQHETWDPKPDAPAEIRGPYRPIASRVPGIHVGELMPRTARLMDRICVLRALSTNDNAHSSSGYWMLTGVPHAPTNFENAKPGAPNDWPCHAAIVQKLRGGRGGLPASVVLPEHIWNNGGISWPGQEGGLLGRTSNPWLIHCQPHEPRFQITGLGLPPELSTDRLDRRLALLDRVNRSLENLDRSVLPVHEARTRQAIDLLRAGKARQAFDLDREPSQVRDRYGRTRWGQSLLLARRLVEEGVSFVQVNWTRMAGEADNSPAWDTHGNNAGNLRRLMPIMDQAYSALLEDLVARNMLDQTLVVWMGEFGRTPRINGAGGRDHWGHVFSGALAGGGIRGGQVLGASDRIGAHPRDGRVLPQDLQATLFHCLGYTPHTEVHDTQGRPLAITRGQLIPGAI